MVKQFGVIAVLIVIVIALIGIVSVVEYFVPQQKQETGTDNLQRYSNYNELIASFSNAFSNSSSYPYLYGLREFGMPLMTANKAVASAESGSAAGTEYSTTNVQVEGVDEADIVKTDGKYAYVVAGGKLFIVDAFPAENASIVSTIEFEKGRAIELFVSGNKLLVFANNYAYDNEKCVQGEKCFGYNGFVSAILYNISDKANPVLEKELDFEGSYLNSRLIDNTAYFIVRSYPRYPIYEIVKDGNLQGKNIIPRMKINNKEETIAKAEEIGYVPGVLPTNFVSIVSLNLGTGKMEKEVLSAAGNAIYASRENLYITAPAWNEETELPVPLKAVGSVFVPEWPSVEKTSISKFRLENGNIEFIGEGIVPGRVLNQFSMDEFNGYFRIATTVGHVARNASTSKNNVYVLDKDMKVVGSLEDLAPGEKIYSARFMGNKCYLVTFKKVDPLFVIDLSNPENPKVLGKLKIPGYSDYLHPIDETHILGLGKETIEAAKGDFAWYQGIKMAIFDVSNPENPIELSKIVIGDRGTDSYALHDHKAFLFDKKRELLVIPITLAVIPEEQKKPLGEEMVYPTYGEFVFQGAFVFNVSVENGITERGRITHVTKEDELKRGYYYGSDYSVKRSFFIDGVLYTLSDRTLKANKLDSLEEISKVNFEKSSETYYPPYYK